jgi:signal transduction histidine kinase
MGTDSDEQEHAVQKDGTEGMRAQLRILSIAVPLAGLAVLYLVRLALLRVWPVVAVDAVLGVLITVGVLAFSWAIFRVIARQDRSLARHLTELEHRYEMERRLRAQLEALHQAALAIASARTPAQILQRLVDLARDLIGARYAALGVLSPQGAIDDFYTAGISAEERARLGPLPQGHGLLGVTLSEGLTLRIPDIAQDPRSVGFPPGHPVMHSLLAVPVAHGATVVGNLYLTEKVGAREFSAEDERLLTLLAGHAAVVIEKARLAEQVRTLAVVAERNRIGQDLHDSVIQALYAVTLELESAAEDVAVDPAIACTRIDVVIDQLGEVIKNMRRHILGLQPAATADQTLPEALAALLAETRADALLETDLSVDGEGVHDLPAALAQDLLQIAREAVTNVVRQARAGRVWVTLEMRGQAVHLQIRDNGSDCETRCETRNVPDHHGLHSLQEWARGLGGAVTIHSARGQGTVLDVRVPVAAPEREDVYV